MKLFTGAFTHAIDAKNRVSVPRRVLEVLSRFGSAGEVVLTPGFDGCLFLYTPEEFERLATAVNDGSVAAAEVRQFARTFFGSAHECPLDKNGRMLLPPSLKEFAGLADKVVFAGVGRRVELWHPDRWNEGQAASRSEYESQAKEVFG